MQEQLLGKGDMLYMPPGTSYPTRIHGAFVSDQEVHKVVEFLKAKGEPNYIDEILNPTHADANESGDIGSIGEKDPLYDEAVEIVLKFKKSLDFICSKNTKNWLQPGGKNNRGYGKSWTGFSYAKQW